MFHAVGGKRVAIEAARSVPGTIPEKSTRIAHNPVDSVLRPAVGGCVRLDRQPLGVNAGGRGQEHAEPPDHSARKIGYEFTYDHGLASHSTMLRGSRIVQETAVEFKPVERHVKQRCVALAAW